MNNETYQALKRIMKYGYWDRGIKDNDVTMVEDWIDEVAKEHEKEAHE